MPENNTWFDALGEPVPYNQRARAVEQAREMGLELEGEEEMEFIGPICEAIERDKPCKAISLTREKLDLTGTYRFLAYLCAPEQQDG